MIVTVAIIGVIALVVLGLIGRSISSRSASRLPGSAGDQHERRARELEAAGDIDGAIMARLAAGQKIEAIKLYRAKTGASLTEAKAAIGALDAARPPGAGGVPRGELSPEVQAFLAKGDYAGAIRQYRGETGASLEQAKEAVAPFAKDDDRAYLSRIGHN